jgi:hypothetical protein
LAAAAQPKAAASKSTSLIMNGWPLLPLQHSKNYTDSATQSLSRTTLEKRGQNFGAGKILPKENRYFKAWKLTQNTVNFTTNYT